MITYHVDELRQFEFELYCDRVRLVPHWSDLGCSKLYLKHKFKQREPSRTERQWTAIHVLGGF